MGMKFYCDKCKKQIEGNARCFLLSKVSLKDGQCSNVVTGCYCSDCFKSILREDKQSYLEGEQIDYSNFSLPEGYEFKRGDKARFIRGLTKVGKNSKEIAEILHLCELDVRREVYRQFPEKREEVKIVHYDSPPLFQEDYKFKYGEKSSVIKKLLSEGKSRKEIAYLMSLDTADVNNVICNIRCREKKKGIRGQEVAQTDNVLIEELKEGDRQPSVESEQEVLQEGKTSTEVENLLRNESEEKGEDEQAIVESEKEADIFSMPPLYPAHYDFGYGEKPRIIRQLLNEGRTRKEIAYLMSLGTDEVNHDINQFKYYERHKEKFRRIHQKNDATEDSQSEQSKDASDTASEIYGNMFDLPVEKLDLPKINALYNAHWTFKDIASEMHCSIDTAKRALIIYRKSVQGVHN